MNHMSDERLTSLLGSLRSERMDRIADDRIRARLETAWTARQGRHGALGLRRLAPALATLALFAGTAGATMNAAGDSPLYGVRVFVEDAAVALHPNPEDRAEYVVSLLEARQTEAARLEAAGNALAAGRVRRIEQDTLRLARAIIPEAPDIQPAPVAAETASPSPSPTPTPSPSPTPSAAATPTPRPPATTTPTRTPTATPTTPTRTPAPTPTPAGTPFIFTATGLVKNADGTPANDVCVRLSTASTECLVKTAADGLYKITTSGRMNQSFALYFTRQDGTTLWKGVATATIKSSSVQMPDTKLQK